MRVLFVERLCPLCKEALEAVLKINRELPLHFQIDVVDVWSGDPRTRVLMNFYNAEHPGQLILPAIILDLPIKVRRFGILRKQNAVRIVIHSVFTSDHLYWLLKTLFREYFYGVGSRL